MIHVRGLASTWGRVRHLQLAVAVLQLAGALLAAGHAHPAAFRAVAAKRLASRLPVLDTASTAASDESSGCPVCHLRCGAPALLPLPARSAAPVLRSTRPARAGERLPAAAPHRRPPARAPPAC